MEDFYNLLEIKDTHCIPASFVIKISSQLILILLVKLYSVIQKSV